MKKLLSAFILTLLLIASGFIMIGCEKDIVPPPDPIEYFTDITYEVIGVGVDIIYSLTYGGWIYSDPNDPITLVWQSTSLGATESAALPWSKTVSTCKGHPVSLNAKTGKKDASLILNIYDDGVLVATKTDDNWLVPLTYNIPNP